MKHSAKFMTFVMALSTAAMVPPASGQTQPAIPGARPAAMQPHERMQPPQQTQTQQKTKSQSQQDSHSRVRQPVPQSEPLRGTLQGARSLELGIPVASRGGPIGGSDN